MLQLPAGVTAAVESADVVLVEGLDVEVAPAGELPDGRTVVDAGFGTAIVDFVVDGEGACPTREMGALVTGAGVDPLPTG